MTEPAPEDVVPDFVPTDEIDEGSVEIGENPEEGLRHAEQRLEELEEVWPELAEDEEDPQRGVVAFEMVMLRHSVRAFRKHLNE